MKTKNLVLAAVAFVFAIGTAFSTSLLINPVWIEAKVSASDPFTCHQVELECDDTPGNTCTITVTVTESGTPTQKQVPLRLSEDDGATCPTALEGTPYMATELEFYDAR